MLLYFRTSSFYCFAYYYYDSVISLLDIFNCSLFKFISGTTFHRLVTGHRIISHSIDNVDVISISGKDIIMYIDSNWLVPEAGTISSSIANWPALLLTPYVTLQYESVLPPCLFFTHIIISGKEKCMHVCHPAADCKTTVTMLLTAQSIQKDCTMQWKQWQRATVYSHVYKSPTQIYFQNTQHIRKVNQFLLPVFDDDTDCPLLFTAAMRQAPHSVYREENDGYENDDYDEFSGCLQHTILSHQ